MEGFASKGLEIAQEGDKMSVLDQLLDSLSGSLVENYQFKLADRSIHFQLVTKQVDGTNIETQIEFSNVRMFCFGDIFECNCPNSFPDSYDEDWIECDDIVAFQQGEARTKVYFAKSEDAYFNTEQNFAMDIIGGTLTISAEKISVNGTCFVWLKQEDGTFAWQSTER